MALKYEESAALMSDMQFRGRIKVSCLNYAKYVIDEDPATPGHSSSLRWAQNTYQNPDLAAQQIQPAVVMEDQVQADGAAITDANLQTATETAIKKLT